MLRSPQLALLLAPALVACAPDALPPAGQRAGADPTLLAARLGAADLGVVALAADAQGRPRLLGAVDPVPLAAATVEDAARRHVARLAPAWGLDAAALPALEPIGSIAVRAGTVVRLRQRLDGLEVDGGELRLLVGAAGELRAAAGVPVSVAAPRARARFRLDEAAAIARATEHVYGRPVAPELARAAPVWRADGDRLVAAWRVEAYATDRPGVDSDAFRTHVAADDGRVLAHVDLTDEAEFTYRVWADAEARPLEGPTEDPSPHPTGSPDRWLPGLVGTRLVTVDSLNALGDPWLPAGATETVGNNADVYVDFNAPNGLSEGDFRGAITAAGTFDHPYDPASGPMASQAQQMAALTQLFFTINWLHDFWYDAGFTEAAGNAQTDNYGRGGIAGDALRIEAQDAALAGQRNNANMATPGDGMPPRMQIYLWSGPETRSLRLEPSGRTPSTNRAGFGPTSFDVSGALALADDGGDAPSQACGAVIGDLTGQIALVDRGSCTFESKAEHVQAAGAIGMIVVNNQAGQTPPFLGDDAQREVDLPALSVTLEEGAAIKAELTGGAVTARMQRESSPEIDGALDATLVAHEFGHYLHHRLSDCRGTRMCGALSEGWGDFVALMHALDADDDLDGAYAVAVYATRGLGTDPAYFGIRRVPYSVDLAKNALSYRHMANGELLPDHHPRAGGGPNSEVHNAGEVWASMLWDGYVELQRAHGFAAARQAMGEYVVSGLLLTPPDASLPETRDAILAAARAASPGDHDILAAAFARRGAGTCAVPPPRDSTTFVGIVESFELRGRADLGTPRLAETASCDDDGVLDAGETARVTVPIVNGGTAALTDVTVTLSSGTAELIITPVTASFASIPAQGSAEATFDVTLEAADGAVAAQLAIAVTASGGCVATTTLELPVAMNVSDVPAASATDDFDARDSVWTPSGEAAAAVWAHVAVSPLDRVWRGLGHGSLSDTALVSPPMTAADAEPLVLTLRHRWSFEASDGVLWDGGVIELSTDDGATWQDVSTWADPGYTGALTTQAGNPLGGRAAFSGDSPAYPGLDTLTLDLGTALAGQTFRLRFRIGTDQAVGAAGWELAELAVAGLTGTPFPVQVADSDVCAPAGPDEDPGPIDDGGCCATGGNPTGALLAGLAVLGALGLRRRRRRA
jgi:large repetitive protein